MKPICVRMLLSEPFSFTPTIDDSRHMGTMRMMASGSDQLSYCADRIRKTSSTQIGKTSTRRVAGRLLLEGQLGPFIAEAVGQRGSAPAPWPRWPGRKNSRVPPGC